MLELNGSIAVSILNIILPILLWRAVYIYNLNNSLNHFEINNS